VIRASQKDTQPEKGKRGRQKRSGSRKGKKRTAVPQPVIETYGTRSIRQDATSKSTGITLGEESEHYIRKVEKRKTRNKTRGKARRE